VVGRCSGGAAPQPASGWSQRRRMPAGAPPPPCCNGGACPCRAIRKLHLETSKTLDVEPEVKLEVEILLQELQQLLIGISIMQVTSGGGGGGGAGPPL